MTIFVKHIKTLTALALVAGALSACTSTRTYDVGASGQVNKLQQDATTAIEDLQTGQRTDVEGVLTAAQKADTAFRMLVAVRNKVQAAYEEIKQMRT